MSRLNDLQQLNRLLLEDMPEYRTQAKSFPKTEDAQWKLYRSLVNVRRPNPIHDMYLAAQKAFLQREIQNITDWRTLQPIEDGIYLWRGDITILKADAIVNAANSGLTGCYFPCHKCIDNAIHTYAGVQLRNYCAGIMEEQGYPEPTGQAKITPAFNLPSKYILHTVGPIVDGVLTDTHREQLASCYRACLELAEENKLQSLAFCCISTGEFHFPNEEAAQIAVREVRRYRQKGGICQVIFNVFTEKDYQIYVDILTPGIPCMV